MRLDPALALALIGWLLAAAGAVVALETRRSRERGAGSIARAVHEIRGPLTVIRLALHPAACGRGLPPERARAIELELERAALALRDLEETGETGALTDSPLELVDLSGLLGACVENWSGFAAARGATLSFEGSPVVDPRPVILGQRLRLVQAVGNLIANAVEHGGGAVEIRCRWDEQVVRVEVTDTGPGLAAPVSELLSAGSVSCRRRGHGLAVVADVASEHAGRLSAALAQRGARLVLELPRADRVTAGHQRPGL